VAVPAPAPASPDRWARFLDDHAPGLTWLAATLLEWAELPPFARKAWRVTASMTRAGEVSGLAALHDETGLLAVAATPDAPPPFLGEPDRVTRLVGDATTLAMVFEGVPMLAVRRLPGFARDVYVFDGDPMPRDPLLRRAKPEEWEALEQFRAAAAPDANPIVREELAGPTQRGLVWVLEGQDGVAGVFRVEGVSRRRVQVTDVCVHPDADARGVGEALMRSAAQIARVEYARGVVVAAASGETADVAALGAGFRKVGVLDDVRLA
jgi:ribosomal protein S18 acetylase RimI-like enzyme